MKNYFKMKNEELIQELEAAGLEVPMRENGNLNRKEAAGILQALESEDDKKKRTLNERAIFTVSGSDTEVGQQAVFVGIAEVGGISYDALIPRETEVDTPAFVYDYLDSLYSTDYVPMEDPISHQIITQTRKSKRYSLNLIERYIKED